MIDQKVSNNSNKYKIQSSSKVEPRLMRIFCCIRCATRSGAGSTTVYYQNRHRKKKGKIFFGGDALHQRKYKISIKFINGQKRTLWNPMKKKIYQINHGNRNNISLKLYKGRTEIEIKSE